MEVICIGCRRRPDELREYQIAAKETGVTPTEFVQSEEGTYNAETGHFACTDCYIRMGTPSSTYGWVAP